MDRREKMLQYQWLGWLCPTISTPSFRKIIHAMNDTDIAVDNNIIVLVVVVTESLSQQYWMMDRFWEERELSLWLWTSFLVGLVAIKVLLPLLSLVVSYALPPPLPPTARPCPLFDFDCLPLPYYGDMTVDAPATTPCLVR